MRLHWVSISILATVTLAGCAPTVWVRPGTTLEEANLVQEHCADVAARVTPASNTRFHGRQTAAAVIGAGLLDAISDGIRQGAAKSDCMASNGFTPVRAAPAPIQTAYVPPQPLPAISAAPPANTPSVALASATYAIPAPLRFDPQPLAPPPVDQRQVMTQDFMSLPDRSKTKAAFLLGACSAGDMSACILSEAYSPKRISLN